MSGVNETKKSCPFVSKVGSADAGCAVNCALYLEEAECCSFKFIAAMMSVMPPIITVDEDTIVRPPTEEKPTAYQKEMDIFGKVMAQKDKVGLKKT